MSKNDEKYLSNKIGLIQAGIAGMAIGSNFLGLEGKEWHYDYGVKSRQLIEKEIREIYRYAYKKGKKSVIPTPTTNK